MTWVAIIFIVIIFGLAFWQGGRLIGRLFNALGITFGGCALTGVIYVLLIVAIGYLIIHFGLLTLGGLFHFAGEFISSFFNIVFGWV